jgi:hypothetical protein
MKTKTTPLKTKQKLFPNKVSLDDFKKVWNDKEQKYTDEQLELIRNWLYAMAEIIVRATEKIKKKYKLLKRTSENENKKSDTLCSGEHRRAS